jgi:hypothetical protein
MDRNDYKELTADLSVKELLLAIKMYYRWTNGGWNTNFDIHAKSLRHV